MDSSDLATSKVVEVVGANQAAQTSQTGLAEQVKPSIGRRFSAEAALLVFGALLNVIGGVLWGWLLPRYHARIEQDNGAVIDSPFDQSEFVSFCIYIAVVVSVALLVALCSPLVLRLIRSAVSWFSDMEWQLLLIANALFGVLVFYGCSELVTGWLWPSPSEGQLQPGSELDIVVQVPAFHGFVVAGLVAAIVGWLRLVWRGGRGN